MKLPLTNSELHALIDDEDFELVRAYKWHLDANGYVMTKKGSARKKQSKVIYLHRLVMRAEKGSEVDHKNHNLLDNRKSELRVATHQQNLRNQHKRQRPTSSVYKGVCWDKTRKKWQVHIRTGEKYLFLGRFENEIKAAKVYDCAATRYFGKFARLNLPSVSSPEQRQVRDESLAGQ